MTKKPKNLIVKEVAALKEMAIDLLPRLISALPQWHSPEQFSASMGAVLAGFAGDRARKLIKEIAGDENNIDAKVLSSERTNQSFAALMKFVAQENPEAETWEAAKKIFKQALRKDVTEQERASLYDMLNICIQLNGSEIKILAGAYQILSTLDEANKNQRHIGWWADKVAENIGFAAREQVLRYEENLIRQKLIAPPEMLRGDTLDLWHPGVGGNGHRLTGLGRKLAELLAK